MNRMFFYTGINATPFDLDLETWNIINVTDLRYMLSNIGANRIVLPKMTAPLTSNSTDITNITWYDETDNYKAYSAGQIPWDATKSHTLVKTRP